MPKINIKKYSYSEGYQEMRCNHCKKKNYHHVVSHYEDREKRVDGKLVIPLELIQVEVYDIPLPLLCENCEKFKKCKDCEIILCNWHNHPHSHTSEENPEYCEGCFIWKVERL